MPVVLRQVLLGLGVVLLQWLVVGRLRLWGVAPDLVLIYVTYQALTHGRLTGTVTGFCAGFAQDLLTNPTNLGLNALVKTLLGFATGLFRSDQGTQLKVNPLQAFLGTLMVAIVHNGLITIAIALEESTRTPYLLFGVWLGGALYTALLALVISLFRGSGRR